MNVVCSGPVAPAWHRVATRELARLVSGLRVAVQAKMQLHITDSLHSDVSQISHASPPSDTDPQVEHAAATVLRGLSSTVVAALFGCAAHLLQIHNQLERTETTLPRYLSHTNSELSSRLQPPESGTQVALSDTSQQAGHAQADDVDLSNADQSLAQALDDADEDGDVNMGNAVEGDAQPGGLQDLAGQVAWLIQLMKLPWQLQPAGAQAANDRSASLALLS